MWFPQGSVLGLLIFSLYIHIYLPKTSNLLNFFLFADSTNIFVECDDATFLIRTVNEKLKRVEYHG